MKRELLTKTGCSNLFVCVVATYEAFQALCGFLKAAVEKVSEWSCGSWAKSHRNQDKFSMDLKHILKQIYPSELLLPQYFYSDS